MAQLTDESLMPFGKYKGTKMANVPATYLLWLFNNELENGNVKDYILANMQGLRQEAAKAKR